jgi:phosphatidyl-myo-inositol dimannoside synthase
MESAIAIVASTFPRYEGDSEPAFILDFARQVSQIGEVCVFVPDHPLSDDSSGWAGVRVERFRYFPVRSQQTLCGDGGIPANIGTFRGKLLLPWLLGAEVLLFIRLLRTAKFRVIHVHWLVPQGFAFAIARTLLRPRSQAPLSILSLHSGRSATVWRLYAGMERWIISHFDRVTVNNEATRAHLAALYQRPIGYLAMGLPSDVEGRPLPLRKDYKLIASVGRFVPVKGYCELVRAWSRRRAELEGFSLVILGKGPLAPALQRLIQVEGLEGQIRVQRAPSREEILSTLGEAGYYFQPSVVLRSGITEGFGLAVLEGLYLGCTAVVTNVGGLPEAVGDSGHVCLDAGEMLDRLIQGTLTPATPTTCRAQASRFTWKSMDLKRHYT